MKNSENNNIGVMLSVGNIVVDTHNNKKYRVVAIVNNEITLCEMDIPNFSLSLVDREVLFSLIVKNEFLIEINEPFPRARSGAGHCRPE